MLADGEVDAFNESRIDVPAVGDQHVIDSVQCPKYDAVAHPDQAALAYGLDDLRVEQR
jgi:hypothetical protein